MKINEFKGPADDVIYGFRHKSGLEVYVFPKKGVNETTAMFAARYGSIDTFRKNSDGSFAPIPEGTAHFLEHKLFESEELAAFDRFAKTGANANAYTTFDRTVYYFSSTDNVADNLEILLDFVTKPYFTEETVQKEQGIIGQEIRMYQDDPDWKVCFNFFRGCYQKNPVRIDVAGTQESIAKIDAKLLYSLYDEFYNLGNMVLVVAGNTDVDTVISVADKVLTGKAGEKPQRNFICETDEPGTHLVREKFSVATKNWIFGYRENLTEPEISLRDEIATNIMLLVLFGTSSYFYRDMLDAGRIDSDFYADHFSCFGCSMIMFGGSGDNPEATAEEIKAEIARVRESGGISEEDFTRTVKKLYGRCIMDYDDVDGVANSIIPIHFSGCKPFDELEIYRTITLEEVNRRLDVFDEKMSVLSIVEPLD